MSLTPHAPLPAPPAGGATTRSRSPLLLPLTSDLLSPSRPSTTPSFLLRLPPPTPFRASPSVFCPRSSCPARGPSPRSRTPSNPPYGGFGGLAPSLPHSFFAASGYGFATLAASRYFPIGRYAGAPAFLTRCARRPPIVPPFCRPDACPPCLHSSPPVRPFRGIALRSMPEPAPPFDSATRLRVSNVA